MAGSYTWDLTARRYRDPRGRFIPTGQALRALERDLAGLTAETDRLAGDLRSGRLSLEAWRMEMMAVIKHVQMGSATLAKGGRAQMQPADHGRVGQLVREQYGFLEAWVADIASGKAPLDGRLDSRARLYVAAGRPTYVTVRFADVTDAGFDEARSILGHAEHCGPCVAQDAIGWQPITEMLPIGDRDCGNNDRCRVEIRNSRTGETQAA
ncbi:MAG TPA: hypothetical protein VGP44_12820 [Gemmatimonadales bacterium]|nr:hypothetical protein [Gemmatimonadales bacterium]